MDKRHVKSNGSHSERRMQKAQNDANKTRVSESKELINALDKINNLSKLQ